MEEGKSILQHWQGNIKQIPHAGGFAGYISFVDTQAVLLGEEFSLNFKRFSCFLKGTVCERKLPASTVTPLFFMGMAM